MLVAHVLSSLELGGQERVALTLAREQARSGLAVLAISLAASARGPLATAFQCAGASVLELRGHDGLDLGLPLRLAALLSRHGVDVVHTHNPRALVYGAPAGVLARCAVVHTKHGMNPDPARRRFVRRVAAAWVDAYVAVTPTLADVARARHECRESVLSVIANGIDVSAFGRDEGMRRALRAELALEPGDFVVGTVGRLAPEKNQACLLEALSQLGVARARLVIVGDGPERARLENRSKELGLAERVTFTGRRDDVARVLTAFDVFALSSHSEGLPLVLLEAMATSLPVVATNVGGIADVVWEGVTGFLVPPGDSKDLGRCLLGLATDPPRARALGDAGRALVAARHSAERMASEYLSLYTDSLARRRLARMSAFAGATP